MKKDLNKILLEAVHRGINLALDDFDDELVGLLTLTIKDTHYTKEYMDLINNYVVDLGLPSGTLWCKYNLGCNYDLLNNKLENTITKDWYGNYYTWGDSKRINVNFETNKCDNYNYKYIKGSEFNLTKYCNNPDFGINGYTDNLILLLPEDDTAYLNMHIGNYKFHIPTKELFDELLKYTTLEKVENYKVNGKQIIDLNGLELTGKNGLKIFFPFAGWCKDTDLNFVGTTTSYWSSSLFLSNPSLAWDMGLGSNVRVGCAQRTRGFPIRPVINL